MFTHVEAVNRKSPGFGPVNAGSVSVPVIFPVFIKVSTLMEVESVPTVALLKT